jgi:hypothetical protein
MAVKMTANITEMKVKSAEKVATLDSVLKVRGSEKTKDTTAVMKENVMVHVPWLEIVLSHSAPTKQCKPYNGIRART